MPSMKMTKLWLERLKNTKSGRIEYFDQIQSGLGLRVGKSKMSWFVFYRVEGDRKLRRYTLGKYPAISLKKARKEARDKISEVDKGHDPGEEKQIFKKAPTFGELSDEYLEKYGIKKRSYYEDNRIIDKDLKPAWESRKAHDIKRRDVIRLLDKIVDRGAPIQANRTLALIRKIFNWGIGRDLVESNPCTQIETPGTEHQRDRVFSETEIKDLWESFEAEGKVIEPMLKLRLVTAQRGGEIESMRWQDINLVSGWWTIPAESSKNNLSHRVPLSDMALDILFAHKKAMDVDLEKTKHKTEKSEKPLDTAKFNKKKEKYSKWVFPSPVYRGNHITNVQKAAQRVKEYSGVDDFKLHDLRRTAASMMTSMGVQRLVVSKILNHVEKGVTRVYDRHAYDDEKRAALDKWSEKLQKIVNYRCSTNKTKIERFDRLKIKKDLLEKSQSPDSDIHPLTYAHIEIIEPMFVDDTLLEDIDNEIVGLTDDLFFECLGESVDYLLSEKFRKKIKKWHETLMGPSISTKNEEHAKKNIKRISEVLLDEKLYFSSKKKTRSLPKGEGKELLLAKELERITWVIDKVLREEVPEHPHERKELLKDKFPEWKSYIDFTVAFHHSSHQIAIKILCKKHNISKGTLMKRLKIGREIKANMKSLDNAAPTKK